MKCFINKQKKPNQINTKQYSTKNGQLLGKHRGISNPRETFDWAKSSSLYWHCLQLTKLVGTNHYLHIFRQFLFPSNTWFFRGQLEDVFGFRSTSQCFYLLWSQSFPGSIFILQHLIDLAVVNLVPRLEAIQLHEHSSEPELVTAKLLCCGPLGSANVYSVSVIRSVPFGTGSSIAWPSYISGAASLSGRWIQLPIVSLLRSMSTRLMMLSAQACTNSFATNFCKAGYRVKIKHLNK